MRLADLITVKVHPDGQEMPSFEQQAWLVYGDGFCPDGGWIDRAFVDQWWHIYITCEHGEWRGVSNGPVDLGRGLQRAIAAARAAHSTSVGAVLGGGIDGNSGSLTSGDDSGPADLDVSPVEVPPDAGRAVADSAARPSVTTETEQR